LIRKNDLAGSLNDLQTAASARGVKPREQMLAWLGTGLIHLVAADFKKAQEAFIQGLQSDPAAPESLVAAGQLREVAHQIKDGHKLIEPRLRSLLGRAPGPGAELARTLRQIIREGALRAGDFDTARKMERELGVPTEWLTAGPFGRHALVDFQREHPPERSPLKPQEGIWLAQKYPDNGQLEISPNRGSGLFYAQCYLKPEKPTELLIRIEGPGPWAAFIDGTRLYAHDSHRRVLPRVAWIPWRAESGWHRFALKGPSSTRPGSYSVEFLTADGSPSELQFA